MYMHVYAYADVCVRICMYMYICICRCIWFWHFQTFPDFPNPFQIGLECSHLSSQLPPTSPPTLLPPSRPPPLCHPITREIHATCIYIYMGAQVLSSEKKGKEPCSQFTQTYSLFVTFVADLVHSCRRRIVCLRHLLQTYFTVFADVRSFLRLYIFRRPSSHFSQTCSLFMIFVADLVCLLLSSLRTKVGNHENM